MINEKKGGVSRLFLCAIKPDSVPILSTTGGSKIEHPEFIEGLVPRLRSERSILQLPVAGKIGGGHLSGTIITGGLKRLSHLNTW